MQSFTKNMNLPLYQIMVIIRVHRIPYQPAVWCTPTLTPIPPSSIHSAIDGFKILLSVIVDLYYAVENQLNMKN